jgi:predicted  nucleic acid-binding Zn-ribbon protein
VRLQDKNKTLDQEIKHLNAAVARQSNAYKSLDKAFDKSRNKAKAEKEVLTKELSTTRKALEAAVSNVKSLADRLFEANADAHAAWESGKLKDQHDVEDHIALDTLHAALDKETEANALLREQIDEKIKQLLLTEQELQAAKDGQTVSAKEIAALNEQVEKLRQDIADRDSKIRNYESDILQLREETTRLTAEKSQLSQDLLNKTAELFRAENDLVAGRQEADKLNKMISDNEATIKDNEATIKKVSEQLKQQTDDKARLEENIKQLNDVINKLNQHDEEDHRNISALSEEMSTLKKEALANSKLSEEEIGKLREEKKMLGEQIGKLHVHDVEDDVEIKKLNQKNAELEDRIKKATDEKNASDKLKGLVEDLQARLAEEEKRKLDEAERERKLDEEAERNTKDAKAAAKDDGQKPMLPHDVVSLHFALFHSHSALL